jgi:elongation factor P
MYGTSDFRNGLKILVDDVPYEITYFQHVKPGKGGAFVRTKLRNLLNRSMLEKTFRPGEKLGVPDISEDQMQFLYADDAMNFMNTSTFEQMAIQESVVGDSKLFLKENETVSVLVFNGEPISVELPSFVELAVAECEPGVKGDTVSGGSKPAVLETGGSVQVPLFINEGDVLKIDTRSKEYVERVTTA